ncbi:hypothetical protein FACS1894132_10130 [Clostridia bacterium]|nr:hypothetical protein FACS1894132_10130 [Clostridia bacterium]
MKKIINWLAIVTLCLSTVMSITADPNVLEPNELKVFGPHELRDNELASSDIIREFKFYTTEQDIIDIFQTYDDMDGYWEYKGWYSRHGELEPTTGLMPLVDTWRICIEFVDGYEPSCNDFAEFGKVRFLSYSSKECYYIMEFESTDVALKFYAEQNYDFVVRARKYPFMSLPSPSPVVTDNTPKDSIIDKINNLDKIKNPTVRDLVLCSKYINDTVTPSKEDAFAYDLNSDGLVNGVDFSLLKRKLISQFSE